MSKKKKRRVKARRQYALSGKKLWPRGILVIAGIIFAIIFIFHQFRPIVETSRSEVEKIPSDVKRNLIMQKLAPFSIQVRVPILMYHYVEYPKDARDKIRQSLNIQPNIFELQLLTLKDAGYTFMTAKELGEVIDGEKLLPKKPIILTFDDGHWDFDTVVLPLLKKYHIKATAYIITGVTGGSDFMSDAQIRDVVASGLVDVGAHTVNHISLSDKLFPVVKYEVDTSKKMLESLYKIDVVSFAYPNGAFDQQAIDIVRDAGFSTAVSTVPGIEQSNQNRFFLYRLRPGYRTGDELLRFIEKDASSLY